MLGLSDRLTGNVYTHTYLWFTNIQKSKRKYYILSLNLTYYYGWFSHDIFLQ